jgi:ribosomal protein S18 acetylase RimI-like enzyme
MFIRAAEENDAFSIAEVQVAAWRQAYAGMMPQFFLDRMSAEKRAPMWRRSLSVPSPGTTDVVMDEAGDLVGFCVYGPSRDEDAMPGTGELVAINLLPRAWRCGFGRAMCLRALAHARQQEWNAMTLWVLDANVQAQSFYASLGFGPDGAEKQDLKLTNAPLRLLRYRRATGT